MRVEVVAIGTELLLGQIVDTNSSWIGEQLAMAGLDSHYQTKVGDNATRINEVLLQALSRSDAVICCGGLGPTQDDITREEIAKVMGADLVADPAIETKIRAMFESRGRVMPENNLRQALVPAGAAAMAQQPGTAPGLVCPLTVDGVAKVIYAVPGVPYEMKEMVTGTVIPDLVARSGTVAVIRSRVLRTWGMSESQLAEVLADRIDELDAAGNPTIAFLASGVEGLKVRITAKSPTPSDAEQALDAEEVVLRQLIGPVVFAVDSTGDEGNNMEKTVMRLLADRGLTVAVAESLTAGYVSGRLCAVPGASESFRGGVTAYHGDLKQSILGVPAGPVVTEETAVAMAEGVRALMSADIGISSTGVAGPTESEGKPVGTVCLAVSALDGSIATTVRLPGDRERIRQFSTITLLDLLRRLLLDS